MKSMSRLAAPFAVLLIATVAVAQTNSNTQTVTLNASVAESLTIALGGVNTVNFTPVPGNPGNAGDNAVSVTTTWVLRPGRTAVALYAHFGSSTAALVHQGACDPVTGCVDIPSAAVEIGVNGGALVPVNQTYAAAFTTTGASLQLFNQSITGLNKNSNRTDVLTFNLNLSSAALQQLPSDDYVGTLTLQAQATP